MPPAGAHFADLPPLMHQPGWENGEYDADKIVLCVCNSNCRGRHFERRCGDAGGVTGSAKGDERDDLPTQSANSSYAFAPRENAGPRYGQCWIATDASRPYGYAGSCANPRVRDPSLDPTYNPEW